jgi:hypothetical protein
MTLWKRIEWQTIEAKHGPDIKRTKVPGGWFVLVTVAGFGGGLTFYADPDHTWDGSSLP